MGVICSAPCLFSCGHPGKQQAGGSLPRLVAGYAIHRVAEKFVLRRIRHAHAQKGFTRAVFCFPRDGHFTSVEMILANLLSSNISRLYS